MINCLVRPDERERGQLPFSDQYAILLSGFANLGETEADIVNCEGETEGDIVNGESDPGKLGSLSVPSYSP